MLPSLSKDRSWILVAAAIGNNRGSPSCHIEAGEATTAKDAAVARAKDATKMMASRV